MRIDVKFSESAAGIPVAFDRLQVITNGLPPEEAEQILRDCNTALEEKGADGADTLGQLPERIGSIETPIYDFGKAVYLTLHDLNPFAVSNPVLNLGQHGGGFQQLTISNYVTNTKVEHLTVNAADTVTECQFSINCSSVRDNRMKRLTLRIPPNAKFRSAYTMCYYCQTLEVIDGTPLDFSETDNNACEFVGCSALRELRFVPECVHISLWFGNSPLLSEMSVQSILGGLKVLADAGGKTLTLHKTTGSKLTQAQKAAITAKNWTLVY